MANQKKMPKKVGAPKSKTIKSSKPQIAEVFVHIDSDMMKLHKQYLEVLDRLDAAKKRGKELLEIGKITKGKTVFEVPIETLTLKELKLMSKFLLECEVNVRKRKEELLLKKSDPK